MEVYIVDYYYYSGPLDEKDDGWYSSIVGVFTTQKKCLEAIQKLLQEDGAYSDKDIFTVYKIRLDDLDDWTRCVVSLNCRGFCDNYGSIDWQENGLREWEWEPQD